MGREPKDRDLEGNTSAGTKHVVASAPASPKRIHRGLKSSPPRDITIQEVHAHALETFGSAEKAGHWMNRPNPLFQGKTPKEVVKCDPSSVDAALARIDYGIYV
jgi:uncharacterized protein (DUF2384 family)